MRCVKTVTPRKIEANRRNAQRSTGPRTERGKSNTRFNAVTLGLFAKHVVIPMCDGDRPEKEFQTLLDGLHQEFHPVGLSEEWLVVKIAACMWRLRRAARCESGSVRQTAIWDNRSRLQSRFEDPSPLELLLEICALNHAEREIRDSGALSQKSYQKVLALVEEKRKCIQSEKLVEADFDREEFLACITDRKEFLEARHGSICRMEDQQSDARFDYDSLVPEEDMDRILRYEERMHRHLDWATQRLLESQERRKTLDLTRDVSIPTGTN
jgi:hypothetical protein